MYFATIGFLTPPSGSGYDSGAEAYFTAASITDTTEKDAVNQLVLDLKGTGSTTNNTDVWSDMLATYPVSPTSLAAAAFNLKDPTSYEITWYNSPIHSDNGVAGNGSSMYGDTGFDASTEFTSGIDLGITYSGDYSAGDTPLGLISGGERLFILTTASQRRYFGNTGSGAIIIANADRGVYTGVSRAADDREFYRNGTSGGTASTSNAITLPSLDIFVLARNNAGSPDMYLNGECDFWALHNALSDNQAVDLYDAVLKYNQTVLVGALDADAKTYIDDAGITNRIEIAAINQLVLDLKGTGSTTNNNNIWTGMNAIYPVSPTSLAAAAFNLKDPTSFEITWYNSPTHATTGITGDGSTMYGDTGYNPNSEGDDVNDFGLTISAEDKTGGYAIGSSSGTNRTGFRYNGTAKISYLGVISSFLQVTNNAEFVNTIVRRSSTDQEMYVEGSSIGSNSTLNTGAAPTQPIYVMCYNSGGTPAGYYSGEWSFVAIHAGLTDGEAQDLADAISTYNANVISGGR